uniref:Membrane zinc transporter n=1 Tax=Ganoderma boninense TaxID=34458 RepID=A0A5K1JV11_9APHY|nr:Membrane zinc transporter [Ganoderma boninense]
MPHHNPAVYPPVEGPYQQLPDHYGVDLHAQTGQLGSQYNHNHTGYSNVAEVSQQLPNPIYSQLEDTHVVAHTPPSAYPQAGAADQQLAAYYGVDLQAEGNQAAGRSDHPVYMNSGETVQQPPADDRGYLEAKGSQVSYHDQGAHRQNAGATYYDVRAQVEDSQLPTSYDYPVYAQGAESNQQPPTHDHLYLQAQAIQVAAGHNLAAHQQDDTGHHQDFLPPIQEYRTNGYIGSIDVPIPQRAENALPMAWDDTDISFLGDTHHTGQTGTDFSIANGETQYYIDSGQSNILWDDLPFEARYPEPNGTLLDFNDNVQLAAGPLQMNAADHFESNILIDVEDEPTGYHLGANQTKHDSHPERDPGGGNAEFAVMILNGMQTISDTLSQLQENQRQFQNQLIATIQSFTGEVSKIKRCAENEPRQTPRGKRQGKPPTGEDLTWAMDVATLDLDPEEAEFEYVQSILKKSKKDLTPEEFRIRNQWNRLTSCVRKYVAMVTGIDDDDSFCENQPTLTDEQVKEYSRRGGTAESIFNDDRVHIDFVRSWKTFSFNKEVRKIVIMGFLDAVNKSGMYCNPPISRRFLLEYWVGKALDGHVITLRRLWKKAKLPLTSEQVNEVARKAAMSSRRATLLQSRISVVQRRRLLLRHMALLEMLSPAHMSGDETDGDAKTHPRRFRIINSRWQSAQLKLFLRTLDGLYREDWEKPYGRRAVSGNEPRVRYETHGSKSVNRPAPIGLWRNCYDEEWMADQKEVFMDDLCVIDDDYDFTLAQDNPDNMTNRSQEQRMSYTE